MMRFAPRLSAFALLFLLGCGGSRTPGGSDAPDASAPSQRVGPVEHLRTLPSVRLDPELHLSRVASGYQLDGFAPKGQRVGTFVPFGAEHFVSTVPARSSDPVHVGVRGKDGKERVFIEVVAEDLASAPSREGQVSAGTIAFARPISSADLVHVVDVGRVEELRIVHQPTDEIVTRHKIVPSAAVRSVRARDNVVEVAGDDGKVAITSAPIVAWDAKGDVVPTRIAVTEKSGIFTLETRVAARGHVFPITIDPTWAPTVPVPPNYHLPAWGLPIPGSSGKVVFVGGGRNVDRFDPFAGSGGAFSALTTMTNGSSSFAATLLADNNTILCASSSPYSWTGTGSSSPIVTWIYDLAAGTTTRVGDLTNIHDFPKMVRLPSGKVVAFGQALGGAGANGSVEIYDPGTKSWSVATTVPPALGRFSMTLLDSGKILVAGGGTYGSSSAAAYLFDPSTNGWAPTANALSGARSDHQATRLADGTVLLVGGAQAAITSTAEIYDPVLDKFTLLTSKMAAAHYYGHRLTTMADGRILVTGGQASSTLSTTEIFDPATKTFSPGPTMIYPHRDHAAVLLPGGRVMVNAGTSDTCNSCALAEILTPDPIVSTDGTGCPSGIAADGYCCDRACTGTCEACNLPGHVGVCTPVVGVPPRAGSCAPFLCAGADSTGAGVCGKTCGSDAGCSTGNYCDIPSGECAPQKTTAAGCGRNGECSSGFCVDGVCCGTACSTKTCQACDVAGSIGTCTDVASGDPHGAHGTCGSYACLAGACASGTCTSDAQCASNRYCVSGSCVTALGQGTPCARDAECQSDHCVDGYCCDAACGSSCQACDVPGKLGVCTNVASGAPHGSRTCAPYAKCNAGACATACSTDPDCSTGNGCAASTCVVRKTNGAACTANAECASGTCADGVCCNTACSGACQACNLTGSVGACTAVDGFADPHAKCASGPCADVCKAGACGFKTATTICSAVSCTAGVATSATCDGVSAACPAASAAPCPGSLACASAAACKTSCLVDGDCTSGVCDPISGKCVGALDAGPIDTGPGDTGVGDTGAADSGTVADTAVADTAVPDTATADTSPVDSGTLEDSRPIAEVGAPKLPETPTVTGFQRCNKSSECVSGHCVEGICCNTACTDRCHSCALLTSPGVCTLEPIGVDLKNECGPALSCLGTCGGSGECIGSGSGTQCARNRCTGPSTGIGPAYCAAPGTACATDEAVPFDCGAYGCEPAFGACMTVCTASRDCAPGFVCDVAGKQCIALPPAAEDSGCSIGETRSSHGWNLGLTLAALAVVARIVRRRTADSPLNLR